MLVQVMAKVALALLLMACPTLACWPGYVDQAVEHADMVLTAKVTHIGPERGHSRNKVYSVVKIQVKEFLKGENLYKKYLKASRMAEGSQEEEEELTILEDPFDFTLDLSSENSPIVDTIMGVDGVTALGTCSGRVRVRDVQIFFLGMKTETEISEGHREATFQVTSQPVKINLDILRLTKAAIQGKCMWKGFFFILFIRFGPVKNSVFIFMHLFTDSIFILFSRIVNSLARKLFYNNAKH
ncbi:uncharacterized protein [Cherax quadricarinatus]|uniref:uncharacterized protein n=1 Tax=Cherax quadricarinatus TaxID=27406 RepID=UPI002377E042|nr:uncharacterized protein LOC128690474 [Cherax quadricarinatus]